MKKKLALALIYCIDVAVVLLGGWRLVPMKINGRTVWEWEREFDRPDYSIHYRRPLADAAKCQEELWKTGKEK